MSVDSLIPGTTLQRGTPWLAGTTRLLPEPRLPQDDQPSAAGRLAQALASLVR